MANLSQHIAAELENVSDTIAQIPPVTRFSSLKTLELIGVATLVSNFYYGIENILKQAALSRKLRVPSDHRWHKNLLDLALQRGFIRQKTHGQLLVLVKLVKPTMKIVMADLIAAGLYSPSSKH